MKFYDLILENKSTLFPIIFILFFALIFFVAYYYQPKQKIKRVLSKLPFNKITTLKTNQFSKITGKVLQVKEPLIAPYSERKCVFYKIKIEQENNNENRTSWSTLIDEEKYQEFFLEQNGELIIIKLSQYSKNFLSYLVVDQKISSGTFNNPTPKFNQLLKNYGINSKDFFGFNKQLKFSEAIIEIGEEITVAGIANWKTLKEPIEGYNYSKIAELKSSDNQKLIITDLSSVKSKNRF